MKSGVVILIVLTLFVVTKADEPRYKQTFISANKLYEFRYISGLEVDKQKWKLVDKNSGKTLYEIEGNFSSQTVFVSNDGQNLVVIDDFSVRKPTKELDVLSFFKAGKLIKKYRLGDLLRDASNVSNSVSHFQWFSRSSLTATSRIKFTTYELVSYEFDFYTGEILHKEVDSILTSDVVYVYGKVTKLSKSVFEMEVCQLVYGQVSDNGRIKFEVGSNEMVSFGDYISQLYSSHYYTLIIKNGKIVAGKDFILNSCTYKAYTK